MSEDSDDVGVSSRRRDHENSSNNDHKKRRIDSAAQSSQRHETVIHDDETVSKPTKAGRKRATRLADLPGMPLDILFEIFGHLHPYDLLKLSRTTKDFRRLLLSRSSISVWKDCLANIPGLPEIFPGMNEVAWVNLVFSPQCHICVTPHIRTIEWRFKLRICSKCAAEHLHEFRSMPIFDYSEGLFLGDMIPTRRVKRGRVLCLKTDYNNVTAEYKVLQDAEARTQYIKERKNPLAIFLEHVKRCEQWEATQVQDRDAELRHLREERLAAIEQKLIDLGWGEDVMDITYPDSLAKHKLVNRPQRLTERVWTNIKPGILEFMEEMRRKRLKRQLDALHVERQRIAIDALRAFRQSKIKESLLMPGRLEFLQFEPVKGIVNAPADVTVTVASFDDVILQLPELVTKWRKRIDQEMSQIIKAIRGDDEEILCYDENSEAYYHKVKKTYPNTDLSEDQLLEKLRLASTVFSCRVCKPSTFDEDYTWEPEEWRPKPSTFPLFYPHVLGHQCLTSRRSYFSDDYWEMDTAKGRPWTCADLAFDIFASKRAQDIVKLAGLDPALATADDMDELNLRFLCHLCYTSDTEHVDSKERVDGEQKDQVLSLFDWQAAVRHQNDNHFGKISYTIVKRDELDDKIIQAEDNYRLNKDSIWRCIHCYSTTKDDQPPRSIDEIESHFNFGHRDISSPILDRDYYKDFAAPNIQASSQYLLLVQRSKNGQFTLAVKPSHLDTIDSDSDDEA